MRELTEMETQNASGGLFFDGSFVPCMGRNWWSSTSQGAIGGAVGGAFIGGGAGAVAGGIIGAVGGSTGAFGYCLLD